MALASALRGVGAGAIFCAQWERGVCVSLVWGLCGIVCGMHEGDVVWNAVWNGV